MTAPEDIRDEIINDTKAACEAGLPEKEIRFKHYTIAKKCKTPAEFLYVARAFAFDVVTKTTCGPDPDHVVDDWAKAALAHMDACGGTVKAAVAVILKNHPDDSNLAFNRVCRRVYRLIEIRKKANNGGRLQDSRIL